jgi:hypothetical protein
VAGIATQQFKARFHADDISKLVVDLANHLTFQKIKRGTGTKKNGKCR